MCRDGFSIGKETASAMIKIKKGLDLPITGAPDQVVQGAPHIKSVAVIGDDYVGMKPTMKVKVGDHVKKGQVLFINKKEDGVCFTSPVSGQVTEVNRGERRVLQSVVISVSGNDTEQFDSYEVGQLPGLSRQQVQDNLVQSGSWVAFKTRPFSKTPALDSEPNSIFVTAIDSNPLAADPSLIINKSEQDFLNGLTVISKLTKGKVFVCAKDGASIPTSSLDNVQLESFSGVHPSGLAGTHIHYLDPVSEHKTVWSINYQEVIAIGRLFTTGQLSPERVISVAGPAVKSPKIVETILGASTSDLTQGLLEEQENRVISGSVLSGRKAAGPFAYLGRFDLQVSVLEEGRDREFLGWHMPGLNKFSVKNMFVSKLIPGKKFAFNTTTHGSLRAMVPVGCYEKVMPLDFEPTFLLRSLVTKDTDEAIKLGALELEEEDLALCTFVDPGKVEYGPLLRQSLTTIEKDG